MTVEVSIRNLKQGAVTHLETEVVIVRPDETATVVVDPAPDLPIPGTAGGLQVRGPEAGHVMTKIKKKVNRLRHRLRRTSDQL